MHCEKGLVLCVQRLDDDLELVVHCPIVRRELETDNWGTIGVMGSQVKSIAALINEINNDELALPDLQRDFVWDDAQIRLLLDSIMRDYPFGSLLLWNTQFLEVVYRKFTKDFQAGQTFQTLVKRAGQKKRMVLDGQQRLQSLYLAFAGTHKGRKLYFNITSGPGFQNEDDDDDLGRNYRFEFWRGDEQNRPKRLVAVSDIIGWADRFEDDEIDAVLKAVPLDGEAANLARRNLRLLRRKFTSDLVPIMLIDDDVIKEEQAKGINEILDIFVRVNDGGTRLSKSDLMFSLIKTKWTRAREHFDELQSDLARIGIDAIDKDFIIRGLLTVSDAPATFEVSVLQNYWDDMEPNFPKLAVALRNAVDFCRAADVRILSSSLLDPVGTLYPVLYYLGKRKNCSVPDAEREKLRTLIYFLLFNRFLGGRNPAARIRYLRDVFWEHPSRALPLDELLGVVAYRQTHHAIQTSAAMLQWNPRLALNIAQPTAAHDTLSWQEKAEVDHVFPQAVYRPVFGDAVDDIGNLAYLGKLRNIRKRDEEPEIYFRPTADEELAQDFLIEDRSLLTHEKFPEFIEQRRTLIVQKVKSFLGR